MWDSVLSASDIAELGAASALGIGNVIPEPSTYALLLGCFSIGAVLVRRRIK